MKFYVNLTHGAVRYGRHLADDVDEQPDQVTFHIDLAKIPGFPHLNDTPRRRRRRSDGPLQRFFDPEREHPLLKAAFEAIGPIIQTLISTQLPALLGSLTDPDEHDKNDA